MTKLRSDEEAVLVFDPVNRTLLCPWCGEEDGEGFKVSGSKINYGSIDWSDQVVSLGVTCENGGPAEAWIHFATHEGRTYVDFETVKAEW